MTRNASIFLVSLSMLAVTIAVGVAIDSPFLRMLGMLIAGVR